MPTLNYNWQTLATWSISKGAATVTFTIDAKLNRQDTNGNYSVVDTRLNSAIVNNLSGSGYSFSLTGATSISGNGIWYFGNETILTGQYTVYHNDNGSASSTVSASVYNKYWGISNTFSGGFDLPTIVRQANITSANNFNDEANPYLTFNNPGNLPINVRLEFAGSRIDRNDVANTGNYTFNLSTSERDLLRSKCTSNSMAVRYVVATKINGTETYWSYLDRTMTIVNGNPTFSNYTYKDTNSTVTDLTENNQVLVKGVSNLQVEISSQNKMIANKKAIAKNYIVTIDSINESVNYSDDDVTINLGTITSSGNKILNVRAYDSRNNSTLVSKDITVYDYDKPVINATVTRLNNFENQITLKVSGTYSKLTINDIDKNIVTSLQYRYREQHGEWSNWTDLVSTISDGQFSCEDVIMSLDNTKAFEFEIQAIDKLQTTILPLTLDIGQAIFFISSNKKTCYINGQEILTYDIIEEF